MQFFFIRTSNEKVPATIVTINNYIPAGLRLSYARRENQRRAGQKRALIPGLFFTLPGFPPVHLPQSNT
jgi:hypothetical protein